MRPKNITPALLLGMLSACANQQLQKPPREQILFENIALAICLGTAAEHASEKDDFSRSAMGYFERSHFSPEVLEHIRSISAEWLNKNYVSKQGGSLESMKCIDMLRSDNLRALYEELTPCKSAAGLLDTLDYAEACN